MKITNLKNPCAGCDECCRYIALEIDKPTTKEEKENCRWYILHKNVGIYIDFDGKWYIEFLTPCLKLKNKRCSFYSERPQMCRDYKAEECTHYNKGVTEKIYFKTEEQLRKYFEKNKKAKKKN